MTLPLRVKQIGSGAAQLWVKTKNKIIKKQLASFILASTILPVTIVPFSGTAISNSDYKSNLVLDANSPKVVMTDAKTSVIQPGESQVEKEAREKAEAEAKAKAEAEAKARAEAEAKARADQASKQRETVSRERRVYSDPADFNSIYERAGAAYGVDPRLLKAVHTVETGASGSTSRTSYAGAQGPMQFLPSTWKRHGVDGNGDGVADITNVEDAIFAAAAYLKACGYPDVKKALWGYNPSNAYYNKVMGIAHSLGM